MKELAFLILVLVLVLVLILLMSEGEKRSFNPYRGVSRKTSIGRSCPKPRISRAPGSLCCLWPFGGLGLSDLLGWAGWKRVTLLGNRCRFNYHDDEVHIKCHFGHGGNFLCFKVFICINGKCGFCVRC